MRVGSRTTLGALTLALALGGAAACGDDDDASGGGADTTGGGEPTTVTVEVDDNFFEPEETQIAVGDTVAWEWVGAEPHNVVGDDFESDMQTEGSFEHTFEESGSYEYVCTIHPGMEGVIEVS